MLRKTAGERLLGNSVEAIKEGQILKIIPKNFRATTVGKVLKVDENYIEMKLFKPSLEDFIENGEVEIFTSCKLGVLYFISKISGKNNDIVKFSNPTDKKILQRREFSRVLFKNKTQIEGFNLTSVDISAGGIKLKSDRPLNVGEIYKISFLLTNDTINCDFQPIAIEECKDEDIIKYTVSGRFKNIKNIDRISIAQFCLKEQMLS